MLLNRYSKIKKADRRDKIIHFINTVCVSNLDYPSIIHSY